MSLLCTCLVASGGVADGDEMETDSIMLKALALLARRGDALIVPSAVAPTATEPGACSSPRLPPC